MHALMAPGNAQFRLHFSARMRARDRSLPLLPRELRFIIRMRSRVSGTHPRALRFESGSPVSQPPSCRISSATRHVEIELAISRSRSRTGYRLARCTGGRSTARWYTRAGNAQHVHAMENI